MWTEQFFAFSVLSFTVCKDLLQDVNDQRDALFQKELDLALGNDIVLSDSEIKANKIVMDLKNSELNRAFYEPEVFNMSRHFFDYKDNIKNTELFKLIQAMPKGAVLHAHDTAVLGADYVLNITYADNLYVCFEDEDIDFLFSSKLPTTRCRTRWQLMGDARYSSGNVEKFDSTLRKHFTLIVENPSEAYADINVIWGTFEHYFVKTSFIFTYKPIWEQYFYDSLKALRDDNVMYLEIRSVLPPLYDLEGNTYDSIHTAETYKKVVDRFVEDYPDFFGAKLIFAPLSMKGETVKGYIEIAKEIKRRLPDFFAGFDIVGQEDRRDPTKGYRHQLVEASGELDYFLHAGETNWNGATSDENLIDAIVLNSKRIGHAFALIKHPLLIEEVKKRGIAVEVNVISNCVLKLVDDVRNHPLASFLAQNLPVVVSSDDPGVWDAEPLSHDFYVAFVGVASRHADLRLLKKLALNSLIYSTHAQKDKLIHEFEIRWTKFIDAVVRDKWNK